MDDQTIATLYQWKAENERMLRAIKRQLSRLERQTKIIGLTAETEEMANQMIDAGFEVVP
jgi:2-keto-3-deoxy-L-rhamnonate aldolase RhmA